MTELIDTIRSAVAEGATADQKAAGALACRTILAALEAEAGKALALAGAPVPGPLAGISPDQALDLLIARLSAIAEKQPAPAAPSAKPAAAPLRIAFVQPPPRSAAGRRKP
jgi:hypothetical protein